MYVDNDFKKNVQGTRDGTGNVACGKVAGTVGEPSVTGMMRTVMEDRRRCEMELAKREVEEAVE